MLHLVPRVRGDQAPQHLVVGRVVLEQHVHLAELAQALHLVAAAAAGVLVDDLGGGKRVAHLGVDARQQMHLVLVRRAAGELLLQLHNDVRQRVQLGGQQQQLVFRQAASGRALHAHPQRPPSGQRFRLAPGGAVQPRQTRALVVAEFALLGAQRFQEADGVLGLVHPLVGVGEIADGAVVFRQYGLQALQNRQGVLDAPFAAARVEQEQKALRLLPGSGHLPLHHVHGLGREAHLDHALGAFEQGRRVVAVGGCEGAPHGLRLGRRGDVHVVAGEAREPMHRLRRRRHLAPVFRHHVRNAAGRLVEVQQPPARLDIHARIAGGLVVGDGLVVALGLHQQVHPRPHQFRIRARVRLQARQQFVQRGVLAVRLHQHRQRVAPVGARAGGRERLPTVLLGLVERARGDRPLGQPHPLAERIAEGVGDAVERQRLRRVAEQRQRDGGAVAEARIALGGHRDQRVEVALGGLRHRQPQGDELPLLLAVGVRRGAFVPRDGARWIAAGVQEASLEQRRVHRFAHRPSGIGGSARGLQVAMPPVQVGDRQQRVGAGGGLPLRRVGESPQALHGAIHAFVDNGFFVQADDRRHVQALAGGNGLHIGRGAGVSGKRPRGQHRRTPSAPESGGQAQRETYGNEATASAAAVAARTARFRTTHQLAPCAAAAGVGKNSSMAAKVVSS